MGSISSLSGSYLQSLLGTALQGAGLTSKTTGHSATGSSAALGSLPADSNQLSPFAKLMSQLQQLQQSNPSKYQQVTQQIATNLQSAAQAAQASGNSTAANQLNQLATDFTNASQSGQLPNLQGLLQAAGGHHHHHHASAGSDSDADTVSSTDTSSSGSTNETVSQLLSAFQVGGLQNDAQNPMSIIMSTLTSAGINSSNS